MKTPETPPTIEFSDCDKAVILMCLDRMAWGLGMQIKTDRNLVEPPAQQSGHFACSFSKRRIELLVDRLVKAGWER